jgi:ubiquinone/menaquinone biosynthesis C-methylase UbiE
MSNQMEQAAAAEFDQWAVSGRAESMAEGHRNAAGQILDRWRLTAADRVLDVGCGNGWAVRWMLERGAGSGVGVDISGAMIERARALTDAGVPATFAVAAGERLPLDDASFSAILSVESLYYYPDPAAALVEWARVSRAGGRLGVMVDLFAENPAGPVWKEALDVEVHLLSEAEFRALAEAAGWRDVETWRVIDSRPVTPESAFTPSRWYPTYAIYRGYREAGSLGITARR